MKKGAILSEDTQYRYVLWREWDETLPKVMFIGLNPSIADATINDPTIRRCIGFAKRWGYGGFYMLNLFAYRSTNPTNLWKVNNPVGNDNDKYILKYTSKVDKVVICWGNLGGYQNRSQQILEMIQEPYCLGKNKNGEPKHPSRLRNDIPLEKYR